MAPYHNDAASTMGAHQEADGVVVAAAPAPPLAGTGGAPDAGPAAAQDAMQPPAVPRIASQRPPPSPFEDVPLHPMLVPTSTADQQAASSSVEGTAAAAEGTNGNRRSPRGIQPTKSALKFGKVGGRESPETGNVTSMEAQPSKGLTWADKHGQVIHHVHEYQPSEHGSEGRKGVGCNCSIQ